MCCSSLGGGNFLLAATQYCGKVLKSGANSITLTCEKVGGVPTMTIEGTNLKGLGGSFFFPDGSTVSTDLRNRITTSTATKIVIKFTNAADSNPQLHTPLYVLMPGEVTFANPSPIDWNATCTAPTEPSITVTEKSLDFDATGSKTLNVTLANLTSDVTVSSSNPLFAIDKTSIPQSTTSTTVTVTCSATTDAEGTITFTSTGATSVNIPVSYSTNTECKGKSKEAMAGQGSFTDGYKYQFETNGSSVNIQFELLDDKTGLNAYLWNYTSGFAETGMTVSGKTATITLTGCTKGTVLKLACKFAYAGGMAVTKQFSYIVGNDCQPKITTDVSESIFTSKDQVNTINVTGSNLSTAVTYIVSADKFQVTESTLTAEGGTVKVKYVSAESIANETITFSSGSATPVVVELRAQATNPIISVNKTDLTVIAGTPQKFTITAQDLSETVAISCTNADFSFSPSVGAQTGSTEISVSYNGTEKGATGVVTLSSEGAASKTVNLTGYYNTECSGFSKDAEQGSFSVGYNYSFITNGNDITCSFELLDTDKTGLNVELWDMTTGVFATHSASLSGKTATGTLKNVTSSTVKIACKFAYAGGMAVTKYFTYTKGHTCNPTIFTNVDAMTFTAPNVPQILSVSSEALTDGMSVSVSGDFTVSPTSLSKDGGNLSVTYIGDESVASGSITLSSTGAVDKVVALNVEVPSPEITVSKSALSFVSTTTEPAAAQTFKVSGSALENVISISCDNDAFTVSPAEIPATGVETDVTVTFTGTEHTTGTITISSENAETKTVALIGYYNTPCAGYLTATGTKNVSFTYNVSEALNGQVTFDFTFAEEVSGLNPQIYFANTNIFRTMTHKGGLSYTLTTDEDAVKSDEFKYQGYFAYAGGSSQTANITYTKGSCDVVLVKIGDKSYTTLAAALDDYTVGSTIDVLGDLNESNTIDKYVKINAMNHNIGNITVETSGKLEFVTNGANINTFIIKSIPNVGAGQVRSNGNTVTAAEAYMERQIYSGQYQQFWYSLSVPFTVDANEGLYTVDGNKISQNTCFFTEYDGANRAEYGFVKAGEVGDAWVYTSNLIRGKAYMIYIMDETINTLRFKATTPSELFNNVDVEAVAFTRFEGAAEATNWGWNFMAQPRLQNAETQVTAGAWGGDVLIQVLENGGNDAGPDGGGSYYKTKPTAGLIMAPFTSFMFQASATGNMNFLYNAAAEPTVKSAEAIEYKYFIVNLSDENGNSDNFFASASEDAKIEGYELGRDLVKCGSSDNNLQICSSDFGLILTANDARLNGGVAEMPLRLSIPKAGNYSLQVTRAATFGNIYLTKNGEVIADLTDGEAYQFAAAKGVNNQFGLRIENGGGITTTAGDEKADINVYATEGIIYVNGVKAAEVRNILGQMVSNPVLQSGAYIVNVEGRNIKINVE